MQVLKPICWHIKSGKATAHVMGVELSVYQNNGKYDCRLNNGRDRPETQSGFDDMEQAIDHAELVLLKNEMAKYFTGVTHGY